MASPKEDDIDAYERQAVGLRRRVEKMASGTFDFGAGQGGAEVFLRERVKLERLEQHIEDLKAARV